MLKHYLKIYLYNIRSSISDITCINNISVNNNRVFQISRSMSSQTSSSMEEGGTFAGKKDRYGGVIVSSTDEPCPSENANFADKLKQSISKWTAEGVRGVWFIVTLQHAAWLPHLAKNGFKFHHGEDDEVTMYRWLPTNQPCGIPKYAHTMVGVGGIVINKKNELLVVMEQNPIIRRWKLPGGYVEPGESISDAIVREIQEETGIQTKFESMVAFRHILKFVFGCADLYFVAEMSPITEDITKDDHEIDKCMWMKVEDFMSDPDASAHNKKFVKNYLKCKELGIKMKMDDSVHDILKNRQLWFTIDSENVPKNDGS